MKKILLWIGIIAAVFLVIAVLAVKFFLDGAVKSGVELVGSKLTGVEVRLEQVKLSLLSGSGTIKGLVVGNPAGYKTPDAISVGGATLSLRPGSLLSDKVVIQKIEVVAPEITFEGDLSGNNLSTILANVEAATGGKGTNAAAKPEPEKEKGKAGKKLEVDSFLISGAKLHIKLTGVTQQALAVTIRDIHLKDLGTGPEGITSAELTKLVLTEIEKEAVRAVKKYASELGKSALKDFEKTGGTNEVSKGIEDLFKKMKK